MRLELLFIMLLIVISGCVSETDKMDDLLKTQLKETSLKRIHIFIKFNESGGRPLDENENYFLYYYGDNNWIISANVSNITEIERLPAVKEMRGITSESKIQSYILEDKIPPGLRNPDGTYRFLVDCYDDVKTEHCRDTLQRYSTNVTKASVNAFIIHVRKEAIYQIAKEDVVRAIEKDKLGTVDLSGFITNSDNITEYCYLGGECNLPMEREKFQIFLKSRYFKPNPGLEYSLYSKLPVLIEKERVSVLIQFESMPNESTKKEISEKNIQLSGYIPSETWIASVSPGEITSLIFDPYIRWIGDIKPVDKVSKAVQQENFNVEGANRTENVTLAVVFFSEGTQERVKEIIKKYNATLVYFGDIVGYGPGMLNDYLINIQRQFVYDLANEEEVSWIESKPGESVPLVM